jgi:hypothetical protein
MRALTPTDWGRIYAYVWLMERRQDPSYKEKLERNPVEAVAEITRILNIPYTPSIDIICDVGEKPAEIPDTDLNKYLSGEKPAKLILRLAC